MESENLEIIKFLCEEKLVNHEHKEFLDRTPFYLACFMGSLNIIEYLYNKKVNINSLSKLGRCALSKACYLNRVAAVEFLLSKPEVVIDLVD